MALRVPWDKQETAILIDAYLRVKKKELSQQEAVKEVSTLLRHRAILSGMEIDDVFRNTNGITMQMKIIGGLVDDCPSSLHSATKMFNEMVALYKSDPAAFYEILIQAKGECAMQVNVQEKFFAWLSAKVSSAQLSEFYIVCKDIESFCMSKHILTEPLFETTNTVLIQGVIDTIKSNRMFQFKYFRHLGKMRKVMDYYMTFLREVPLHQSKEPEKVPTPNNEMVDSSEEYIEANNTATANEETVVVAVQDEVTISVIEDENTPAESNAGSIEVVATDDSSIETLVWNFANDNVDFTNTSPKAISYFDEEEKVQGWADAFVKIVRAMQEDYPSIIRGMVGYRFVGIGKVVLTGIAGIGRFSKPIELNNEQLLKPLIFGALLVKLPLHLLSFCGSERRGICHGKNIVQVYYVPDILPERFQHNICKRLVTHPVGRTGFILFVRRADVVDILFISGGDGFAYHACAALTAEYHTAEKLYGAVAGAAAGIQRKCLLHAVKIPLLNDGFVGIRNGRPFAFRLCDTLSHLVAGGGLLALNEHAGVDRIFQDTEHGVGRPYRLRVRLEGSGELHAERFLVLHRREHSVAVQTGGNVLRTHALQLPRKDVPHDICGIFVYDQVIFVCFILQIAVHGKCADILAALALDLKLGTDFHGNIPAVGFVYEILEWNDKLVRSVFSTEAVVVVVDGNEPHA